MNHGLSDQVRAVAVEKFVQPALHAGKTQFSISVREMMHHLQPCGFPARTWPQICSALQTGKFLRAHRLEIESIGGPPSKMSNTVVISYRVAYSASPAQNIVQYALKKSVVPPQETSSERARRLTGKLCGLLKDELAAYGGGEAFLRWVRSEDENAA